MAHQTSVLCAEKHLRLMNQCLGWYASMCSMWNVGQHTCAMVMRLPVLCAEVDAMSLHDSACRCNSLRSSPCRARHRDLSHRTDRSPNQMCIRFSHHPIKPHNKKHRVPARHFCRPCPEHRILITINILIFTLILLQNQFEPIDWIDCRINKKNLSFHRKINSTASKFEHQNQYKNQYKNQCESI